MRRRIPRAVHVLGPLMPILYPPGTLYPPGMPDVDNIGWGLYSQFYVRTLLGEPPKGPSFWVVASAC